MPQQGQPPTTVAAALANLQRQIDRLTRRPAPASTGGGTTDFRAVYLYLAHSGGAPDTTLGSSVMPKNAADGVHDVSCTTAIVSGDQTVVLLTHPGSTGDYANLLFEVTKIADAAGTPITHVKETQNTGFFARTAGVLSTSGATYTGSLFTTNSFDPGVTITTAGWYVVYASLAWI